MFDHCNLEDVIVRLNTKRYPKNELDNDFTRNKFSVVYDNLIGSRKSSMDMIH